MFVVIAESKVTAGQLIYLIKAKRSRWRVVGRLGSEGPQEFATVERASAEIRRATQSLSCKVITKEAFCKLWSLKRKQQETSHLERLLDRKMRLMDNPVEMDDSSYEMTDAEWGTSDGGHTEYKI